MREIELIEQAIDIIGDEISECIANMDTALSLCEDAELITLLEGTKKRLEELNTRGEEI